MSKVEESQRSDTADASPIVARYPAALGQLLLALQHFDVDTEYPTSLEPLARPPELEPLPTLQEHLRQVLRSIIDALAPIKPDVDLAGVQVARPIVAGPADSGSPFLAQAWTGGEELLAIARRAYREFPSSEQPYSFMNWRADRYLRVQILRKANPIAVRESHGAASTVVLEAKHLHAALLESDPTKQLGMLKATAHFQTRDNDSAASILLTSTRTSLALLDVDTQWAERNILFLPVYAGHDVIGGAVLHSPTEFPDSDVYLFETAIRLMISRIRTREDIVAAYNVAAEAARWDATMLFIHRLQHDVRKPLRTVKVCMRDLLASLTLTDSETRAADAINKRLNDLQLLLETGATADIDDLRLQARDDARVDSVRELLDDAVWLWKLDAEKANKTIVANVPTDIHLRFPRYLVSEVLENLLVNAVAAAHSLVTITAAPCLYHQRKAVKFEIENDGQSMPQAKIAALRSRSWPLLNANSGRGIALSNFISTALLDGPLLEYPICASGQKVVFIVGETESKDVGK